MSPADNARADGLPGPLPSSPDGASRPERIVSVDALRGFDMFWIIGGEQVAEALDKMGGGPVASAIATQLKHVEWEGFRFYDVVFPLFLFLIGVSIVISMDRMVATVGRRGAIARIARRRLAHKPIGKQATQADARPPAEILADVSGTVSGSFAEGRNLAH